MGFSLGFNLLKMGRLLYRIQTALEWCAMWCVVKFFFFFSLSLFYYFYFLYFFFFFFFCGGGGGCFFFFFFLGAGGGGGELSFVETLRQMKCTYALMPS